MVDCHSIGRGSNPRRGAIFNYNLECEGKDVTSIFAITILLVVTFALSFGVYLLIYLNLQGWIIRKYVHVLIPSLIPVYRFFLDDIQEAIILLLIVGSIALLLTIIPKVRFILFISEHSTREEKTYQVMINTGFTLGIYILTAFIFWDQPQIFSAGIYAVAWGDGAGEVIGRPLGRHEFKIFEKKSVEGSVAVFVGVMLGIIAGYLLFSVFSWSYLLIFLIVSLGATILEFSSYLFLDNLIIPTWVCTFLYFAL